MKIHRQLELLPPESAPQTLELTGAELVGLEARLAAQGRYLVGFAPHKGARWRVIVAHLPTRQFPSH